MKTVLIQSLNSSWMIIKLIIPIYIIADIIYYYNALSYISFLFEPITSILNLPPETALSIISGMFLNLYAAIAFAAPLDMTPQQWSTLALFLGVCHALVIENVIMVKLGFSSFYSYLLRIVGGMFISYSATLMPSDWFNAITNNSTFHKTTYMSLPNLLFGSLNNAVILAIKIILIITLLIFMMEFVKNLSFVKKSSHNVGKYFSISAGLILGIIYGAGIIMKETNNIEKKDLFFIGTFLMLCHAIIEDTLLFVIFGADLFMVVLIRIVWTIVISYLLLGAYRLLQSR